MNCVYIDIWTNYSLNDKRHKTIQDYFLFELVN